MAKTKYHIIRLAAGQECPAGYDSRTVRGATICTKKLSAEEIAFAAAAQIPEVASAPVADPAVDELEALMAGMGMGQQAVVEWGGEGNAMNMEGGKRSERKSRRRRHSRKSHRKSHRKTHRRSSHRKGASRRTRRYA